MPSPKIAPAILASETQTALSLPMAALILGAVSQLETIIEVVDRVCAPLFCGAMKTAGSTVALRVRTELPTFTLQ